MKLFAVVDIFVRVMALLVLMLVIFGYIPVALFLFIIE